MKAEAMTSERQSPGGDDIVDAAFSRREQRAGEPSWGPSSWRGRLVLRSDTQGFWRVWSVPIALALVIVFGLLSALLGQNGVWWVLSWIALAAPLAVILFCLRRAARREPRTKTRP